MIVVNELNFNKFRNPVNNQRWTRQLFFESSIPSTNGKAWVLYSLKEEDWVPAGQTVAIPSFQRLYLEFEDITEYAPATELLDGVEHWDLLCQCEWFIPHLERMRRALYLRLQARALKQLQLDARNPDSKSATSSARFLVERGYDSASPNKRRAGRPSKAEILAETNKLATIQNTLDDDFERIVTQ